MWVVNSSNCEAAAAFVGISAFLILLQIVLKVKHKVLSTVLLDTFAGTTTMAHLDEIPLILLCETGRI